MSTRKAVLIVEDDKDIRDNLRELLEIEGYPVAEAANGRQALDQLERDNAGVGLILLDLNMPVMAGGEFLAAKREAPATISALPVIIMTAVPRTELKAQGFVRKPIDLDELLPLIKSLHPGA